MRDFTESMKEITRRVEEAHVYLKIDEAKTQLGELEELAADPALWDDQDKARQVTSQLSSLKADIDMIDELRTKLSDIKTMDELMREAGDE